MKEKMSREKKKGRAKQGKIMRNKPKKERNKDELQWGRSIIDVDHIIKGNKLHVGTVNNGTWQQRKQNKRQTRNKL